ncbi:carbon-nitrogen family hydrolase [Alkalibacillus haloalkaliphilus]|uniref:Hydrolase n=1 Tax=Alkalibacillus haloalkaliphilus TaxID=94136 RepID=A0A511W248_9BACI|nr:carbon-nitrogen family hydrolase [Alkalibacillus haloalkaliphilus]GEN44438.1 hydrolase [Alkalibacillus haloalkaliphilus]
MQVALLQLDLAFGDVEVNKEKINHMIHKIPDETDVIVLPELWNTCYDLKRLDQLADYDGWDSRAFLSHLAYRHEAAIVGGSVAKVGEQGFTNTMYIYNKKGHFIKEYSKAHLIPLMHEQKYFKAGDRDGLFEVGGIPSAGLICYDLRFPEWVRWHAVQGAKVIYIVAQWPKERINHWRTLIQARAIENQCFVVACNRVGDDPNFSFGGHSMVVGPMGELIVEGGDEEGILTAMLDLDQVAKARSLVPVYNDIRSDLYDLRLK